MRCRFATIQILIIGSMAAVTWKGRHPIVKRLHGEYPDGVRVAAKEMKEYEARLERSATLPKYDITIKPRITEQQGN